MKVFKTFIGFHRPGFQSVVTMAPTCQRTFNKCTLYIHVLTKDQNFKLLRFVRRGFYIYTKFQYVCCFMFTLV